MHKNKNMNDTILSYHVVDNIELFVKNLIHKLNNLQFYVFNNFHSSFSHSYKFIFVVNSKILDLFG